MDKLCEIKEGLKKHKVLYMTIILLIIYRSMESLLDEKDGSIGDKAYAVLNPFTVTPYILWF